MPTIKEELYDILLQNLDQDRKWLALPNGEMQYFCNHDGLEEEKGQFETKNETKTYAKWKLPKVINPYASHIPDEFIKNFRIPVKQDETDCKDSRIAKFDLRKHCKSIAVSGWDYVDRVSRFVFVDFDGGNHGGKNVCSSQEIEEIKQTIQETGVGQLTYSKSGIGLHWFIPFTNPPKAVDRKHHRMNANGILKQIEKKYGTTLLSLKKDCIGGMAHIITNKEILK